MPAPTDTEIRYPVGTFTFEGPLDTAGRSSRIEQLAAAPGHLAAALRDLDDRQLDTPYRSGGWTVRQIAHHLPDSHLNAVVRLRLALTEDAPTIKPYDQERWADLADARTAPVAASLALLEGLHARWVTLLGSLAPADFARTVRHPEYPERVLTVDWLLALYAWHGRHHVGQITAFRRRQGWV